MGPRNTAGDRRIGHAAVVEQDTLDELAPVDRGREGLAHLARLQRRPVELKPSVMMQLPPPGPKRTSAVVALPERCSRAISLGATRPTKSTSPTVSACACVAASGMTRNTSRSTLSRPCLK